MPSAKNAEGFFVFKNYPHIRNLKKHKFTLLYAAKKSLKNLTDIAHFYSIYTI